VAGVITRLYDDVKANAAKKEKIFGAMSEAERASFSSTAPADYREAYGQAKELYLAVAPQTARLLYMQARSIGAHSIVEFGTSFGVSTVHLAAALRDNGGGRVVGTEFEPAKIEQAYENLKEAGLDDLVDIREGDALETLARDLPKEIDFVLMDGHKPLYPKVLDLLTPHLRHGACLVADNASSNEDYLDRVRASDGGFLSVPYEGDVEISIKL
jgi:predicted O-methyltransferase YrrM